MTQESRTEVPQTQDRLPVIYMIYYIMSQQVILKDSNTFTEHYRRNKLYHLSSVYNS